MTAYSIGSKVFISNPGFGPQKPMTPALVEKITKTEVTASGRRFKIASGREVNGDYWHCPHIYAATPELEASQAKLRQVRYAETELKLLVALLSKQKGDDAIKAVAALKGVCAEWLKKDAGQ